VTGITVEAAGDDIISLGVRADEVRRRMHGLRTTFLRVAEVPAEPGGPVSWPAGTGEIRISGTPSSRFTAISRVAEIASRANGIPVSGYSLADLEQLAAAERITLRVLLEELRAAGLELISEAPFDRLLDPARSVEQVNIAGLRLSRLTIDQLPATEATTLLGRIAELQRAVAVVRAFAPLPRRMNPAAPTTGFDDVKRIAMARLVIENIPSIQVDWALYGSKLAQVALTVGADDVDAVSASEESPLGPRRSPLAEIRRNIRAAGQEPAERNGRFDVVG
jgi:aminodeoxyfutalosine synthase